MPLITLTAWAERQFDPPPKLPTLRAWAASGRITPSPVKVGRTWMVREDAEYSPTDMQAAGLSGRALAILRAA